MPPLIVSTDRGLYCPSGDFLIDPWQPDPGKLAVITHAHSDHARTGAAGYLTSPTGAFMLRARLGASINLTTQGWGESHATRIGDVRLSLYPAGHVLGSAMVRIQHAGGRAEKDEGGIWLISGDYKLEPDGVSEPTELTRCDTFITESTFGLPIYRWQPQAEIFAQINDWWRASQSQGRTAVLFAYALGKAQRLIAGVDPSIGPILAHGAVLSLVEACRAAGAALPPVAHATRAAVKEAAASGRSALVIAPPSADGSAWLRGFGEVSRASASGWMTIRGRRRWKSMDRGFVLSDHADWPALLHAIDATGAARVGVTHGYTTALARYLNEHGREAWPIATSFTGEQGAAEPDPVTP